jgi:hypothetical protein
MTATREYTPLEDALSQGKSMNTQDENVAAEVADVGQAEPADATADSPASRDPNSDRVGYLREQLARKDLLEDKEALAAVNRIFNIFAVSYAKELDDGLALAMLALVGVGRKKGIKSAKEAKINSNRWRTKNSPPALELLANEDEQKAALVALTKPLQKWALCYLMRVALDTSLPASVRKEATAQFPRNDMAAQEYVDAMADYLASNRNLEPLRILKALEFGFAGAKPEHRNIGREFDVSLLRLVDIVHGALMETNADAGIREKIGLMLLANIEMVTAAEPDWLTRAKVLQALAIVKAMSRTGDRKVAEKLTKLSKRLMSVLNAIATPISEDEILVAEKILPRPDNSAWPVRATAVAAEGAERHSSVDVDLAQAMLSAFERLDDLQRESPEMKELAGAVRALCAHRAVSLLGERGELVKYSPFEHSSDDVGISPGKSARVVFPGVVFRRVDGSYRVLVKALVNAAE